MNHTQSNTAFPFNRTSTGNSSTVTEAAIFAPSGVVFRKSEPLPFQSAYCAKAEEAESATRAEKTRGVVVRKAGFIIENGTMVTKTSSITKEPPEPLTKSKSTGARSAVECVRLVAAVTQATCRATALRATGHVASKSP